MKRFKSFRIAQFSFVLLTCIYFSSCTYSTLQTATTKAPGQAEFSAGYQQVGNDDLEDPVRMMAINARIGVARGFDMGLEHTFDITDGNEAMLNTIWGDAKYQFTNKDNENKKLTFSSGLIKGYIYDSSAKVHLTSLPLYFSLPVGTRFTPTFMYRFKLASDGFIPNGDSFEDPLHLFAFGAEYSLKEPDPSKWIPKLALTLGTLQGFQSDMEDSSGFLINLGLKIDSPYGNKQ